MEKPGSSRRSLTVEMMSLLLRKHHQLDQLKGVDPIKTGGSRERTSRVAHPERR